MTTPDAPRRNRRRERPGLKRWGSILTWAGLAVLLLGLGACGVSCVGGLQSFGVGISGDTEGAMATKNFAGSVGVASMAMMAGGLGLALIGNILKAAGSR